MKIQIEDNHLIKSCFGDVINKELKYNASEIELDIKPQRSKIQCVSSTSSVRGINYGSFRVGLLILDDAQDEKQITTDKACADLNARINNGILKALQNKNNHVVALGTVQRKGDLYDTLLHSTTWKSHTEKCILVDDIDEYFRTSKGWQTIRKILRTKNTNENALYDAENNYLEHKQELDFPLIWNNYDCFDLALEYFEDSVSFKKERQCDINSLGEKRITSLSAIPAKDIENKEFTNTILSVDPASTANKKSDYSAFCVLSDTENHIKYARKCIIDRLEFNDYIKMILSLLVKYPDINTISIEKQTYSGADVIKLREQIQRIPELMCRPITYINKARTKNKDSYLMNEIQKLYGCYIIFDTANMTINLIEQSDIFKYKSGAVISWRNALKALTITNQNTKYITAMKVNCDSDTYGISLVNPSGSNVIYNFDSVLDKMNYSVDDTHINPNTNNPYTLAELVTLWKSTFNSFITSYRSLGNSLIENTKKLETYTELLQVAFAKYQKFVDANNNKVSFQLPNIPQPEYLFSTGDYKCYNGNNDLNYYYATSNDYDDISAANSAYWGFYNTYSATVTAITQTTERMKAMALPLTFNYKTIKKEYDSYGGTANYKPIFTPTEIKELYKFIYEGEWGTSIIKFSDDFKPTDIYNSLIDIFTVAKTEMDNIYSKPIYEFSAEIADIFRMEEMRAACADICLGNSLYIADGDNWIMPVLLQVNVDYDKTNGTTMTFSTDYKRKPLEYRFAKLFATIQQTSVKTSKFTFD